MSKQKDDISEGNFNYTYNFGGKNLFSCLVNSLNFDQLLVNLIVNRDKYVCTGTSPKKE